MRSEARSLHDSNEFFHLIFDYRVLFFFFEWCGALHSSSMDPLDASLERSKVVNFSSTRSIDARTVHVWGRRHKTAKFIVAECMYVLEEDRSEFVWKDGASGIFP